MTRQTYRTMTRIFALTLVAGSAGVLATEKESLAMEGAWEPAREGSWYSGGSYYPDTPPTKMAKADPKESEAYTPLVEPEPMPEPMPEPVPEVKPEPATQPKYQPVYEQPAKPAADSGRDGTWVTIEPIGAAHTSTQTTQTTIQTTTTEIDSSYQYEPVIEATPTDIAPLPGIDAYAADAGLHPDLARDGIGYSVSGFLFEYPLSHESLPDLGVFQDVVVPLTLTDEGWIGPLGDVAPEMIRLGDVPGLSQHIFYGSAIAAVNESVRAYLEQNYGMIGHLVTPSSDEIDFELTREDLRAGGNGPLTVQIWRASVGNVRTIAYGQQWDKYRNLHTEEEAHPDGGVLNAQRHHIIRDQSPAKEGTLLVRPPIDRHIYHLNRHPGRRVDLSLTPTGMPGEVGLDYMITEAKDWAVYAQVSNTGTASTDPWVYRIGYFNNQLTDRDDILSIDYITAGFDESHTIMGSYDWRLRDDGRVRGKVYGRWNQYTASDVGFGFDTFKGEGYEVGAEVAWNVWQSGPRFIDVVGGARYEHIEVDNQLVFIKGDESFLIPYIGIRALRNTPMKSFFADLTLDFGFGMDGDDAVKLGRFDVDSDWMALRGGASFSFFLEPLLNPAGFKGEKNPDQMTLAHEIYLSMRGQYAFGNRLVPNYQNTAGGFYTVRGYDESEAVGDDAIIATAEYRFHLGKALPQSTQLQSLMGRPFRTARSEPYGSADWDMIFRGFVDAARVMNNDRDPTSETDATLVGVGIGGELHIKNNVTIRLDYGYALTGVGEGALRRAGSGDSRLHFMAQLLY